MSLVTHTQPVIRNYHCILLLLLIGRCSCEVHKEWHPGVPKYFNFIHRSKAVHVRVNGKGSTVFADPSMSVVNTMSENHGNTGDSYTRSGTGYHRTRGKDKNNEKMNKNSTAEASRRTFALIRKGGCPCLSPNDTVIHTAHKQKWQNGKKLKTNRGRVVVAKIHTGKSLFRTSDSINRKCKAKISCRNRTYVRKRQNIIRQSDSPSNRLFDITKIKSRTNDDFHSTGWEKQDANVSSINATMPSKKDSENDTKSLNITKVADVFKEKKANTTPTAIEKIAPVIKDAQFAKILPHADELAKVAEINLNPFAHMDDDIIPPPSQSTFNKTPTPTTSASPESVIQKFLDAHEKPLNSSDPRTISYLPNNTIDDLNSLIERASVLPNKLKDSDIKTLANNTILMETQSSSNDDEKDKELADLLRLEDDAMRRKQSKSIKLKDTSLINMINNTMIIENAKPKKHKNDSNVQKGIHREKKRPDSNILSSSSDAKNKSESTIPRLNNQTSNKTDSTVSERNDFNTTSKSESSGPRQSSKNAKSAENKTALETDTNSATMTTTGLLDSLSPTMLQVQKNESVMGNKRINDTILHADIIETDKNKTNQKNPNQTETSPPADKPASSANDSQPIIPENGPTHKNVSQHTRQRRVNATKLVINAVLDAVRKEMVNRSIGTQQINNSIHEFTTTHDTTDAHRINNDTWFSENLVESSGSNAASINSVTKADSGGAKEAGDVPDGGVPQHTRQRRVNATKVTINAVLEAVRDELFNRLEEENGLKNTSSSKGESNGTSDVVSAPAKQKQKQQQQQQQQQQLKSSSQQQRQNQADGNSSITRNESFSIRNSNNTLVSNVSLSSSVKTSGSGTIESHNSTLETAGSSKAPFRPVNIDEPAEQVVWENNLHTDEPAKLKDVKLNVDPSAEALYGSHNVLQPIYENFGDFYDRNARLDYRAEPVFYRVESEGGFAHKHRDIPARYWRG